MMGCYPKSWFVMSYNKYWQREYKRYNESLIARDVPYERRRQLLGRFVRLTLRSD
jgi:hypothetical protein